MSSGLAGGVAVITGAANGLGAAIARNAASRGMRLVLADVQRTALLALANELNNNGVEAVAVTSDITDPEACEHLAQFTFARFGSVRLLFNNAGIETTGEAWRVPPSRWARVVATNLLGPTYGLHAFVPRMIDADEPAYIATTASLGALGAMPFNSAYIASKHAVLALCECLHMELGRVAPKIRVSAVLPGPVSTAIFATAQAQGEAAEKYRSVMDAYLEKYGISPTEAAAMIMAQVESGAFWVTTHPNLMREAAAHRAAYLSELREPSLDQAAAELLSVTER